MSPTDGTLGAAWLALRRRAIALGRLLSGQVETRVQEQARDLAELYAGMATVDRNHARLAESTARHLAGLQAASETMGLELARLQAAQQVFERSVREQLAELQSAATAVAAEVAALHAGLRSLESTVADVERGQTAIATALARATPADPRREA